MGVCISIIINTFCWALDEGKEVRAIFKIYALSLKLPPFSLKFSILISLHTKYAKGSI